MVPEGPIIFGGSSYRLTHSDQIRHGNPAREGACFGVDSTLRPHNLHTPTVPHGTTVEQSNFSWRLKLGGLTFYGVQPLLERGLLREKMLRPVSRTFHMLFRQL